MAPVYEYQPLKPGSIRIFTLSPGQSGEPLAGSIAKHQANGETDKAQQTWSYEARRIVPVTYDASGRPRSRDVRTASRPLLTGSVQEAEIDLMASPRLCEGYEAVSYAWGDTVRSQTILIDDGSALAIPESLHEALQHLRFQTLSRRLWVDSICINQSNTQEKTSQVQRMHEIYKNATRTIVWLGPAQPLDALAFAHIDEIRVLCDREFIQEMMNDGRTDYGTVAEIGPRLSSLKRDTQSPSDDTHSGADQAFSEALQGLVMLARRPWFERLWVVQELGLSRDPLMQSGAYVRNFEALQNSIDYALEMEWISADQDSLPGWIEDEFLTENTSLLALVLLPWQLKCRDPRDRIFAMLNLQRDSAYRDSVMAAELDYALDIREIYSRATEIMLTGGFTKLASASEPTSVILAIAPLSHGGKTEIATWPSWVPDFHNLTRRCSVRQYCYFEDRGSSSETIKIEHHNAKTHRLRLTGRCVGRISTIMHDSQMTRIPEFAVCPHDALPRRAESKCSCDLKHDLSFASWATSCANYLRRYGCNIARQAKMADKQPLEDCTWSNPCIFANYMITGSVTGLRNTTSKKWICWKLDHIAMVILLLFLFHDEKDSNDISASIRGAGLTKLTWMDPERLLGTAESSTEDFPFAGWLPETTRVGDRVFVFKGAPWPFIVRNDDKRKAFRLIGDALIPGIKNVSQPSSERQWIDLI